MKGKIFDIKRLKKHKKGAVKKQSEKSEVHG